MSGRPDEHLSRVEERLVEVLEPLRSDPPRSSVVLVERTVRAARWQRHVRVPLQLVGHLAGVLLAAAELVAGQERGTR